MEIQIEIYLTFVYHIGQSFSSISHTVFLQPGPGVPSSRFRPPPGFPSPRTALPESTDADLLYWIQQQSEIRLGSQVPFVEFQFEVISAAILKQQVNMNTRHSAQRPSSIGSQRHHQP